MSFTTDEVHRLADLLAGLGEEALGAAAEFADRCELEGYEPGARLWRGVVSALLHLRQANS